MRRLLILALLALALPGTAWPDDRRTDRDRLTVMTFNGEFMWDGVAPEEGSADFPWKGNPDEARDHMQLVAEVIRAADADVVNLVEVENLQALELLNDQFLRGMDYAPYLVAGNDTFTGQDIGLLTRIDPDELGRIDEEGVSGRVRKTVTKNYFATLAVGDRRIALVGLHLLAQPNSVERLHPRQAQADAIRGLAAELAERGHELVVLGDFNDYDEAPESRDHVNSMPITRVVSTVKTVRPDDPADDLMNVARFIPQDERYTAFWDRDEDDVVDRPQEFTSIDHILVSPGLAAVVERVAIPKTHDPRVTSDHFPIIVTFNLTGSAPPPDPPPVALPGALPVMVSLLPNPSGDEEQDEAVTLANPGGPSISLVGWRLRDAAGKSWILDGAGTLGPGAEVTVLRRGQPMALNNGGDRIVLVDPAGTAVQEFSYGDTIEGEELVVAGR